MEQFIIEGGARLEGTITPAGNKNAALPALITTLQTDEDVVLRNLPDILDIRTIVEILEDLGVQGDSSGPERAVDSGDCPDQDNAAAGSLPQCSRCLHVRRTPGCPPRRGADSPPRR